MSSLDTEFGRRLLKKVNEAEATSMEHMRSGALDHEQYKDRCGYMRALNDVREWAAEIETNITEGK